LVLFESILSFFVFAIESSFILAWRGFLFLGEGRLGCETGVVWMTWNLQGFFKGGGESGSFFIYFM